LHRAEISKANLFFLVLAQVLACLLLVVVAMFVLVMTQETSEQEQVWLSDYQTVRFLSTRLRIFARSF
jgi:hypothetical protein